MMKSDGEPTEIQHMWGSYVDNTNYTEVWRSVPRTHRYIADEHPRFLRFGDCRHFDGKYDVYNRVCSGQEYKSTTNLAWGSYISLSSMVIDSSFNARAFSGMKPRIEPAIQAPVELRELVLGWKQLLKPIKSGSSIFSKAGSANLWWQFGVAPTVGAVQDVIKGLKEFEQRLIDFRRLQRKPLTSHYSEVEKVEGDEDTLAEGGDPDFGYRHSHAYKSYKIIHTATMSYSYTIVGLDGMTDFEVWLRALGDLLGVSRKLAMLWESTPWSFIVDWFFTVGDFLEQFDTPFLDTAVVVKDYCISLKVERSGTIYMEREYHSRVSAGWYQEKLYHRVRCLPDYSSFGIRLSGNFGPKQFLLGVSLLVA